MPDLTQKFLMNTSSLCIQRKCVVVSSAYVLIPVFMFIFMLIFVFVFIFALATILILAVAFAVLRDVFVVVPVFLHEVDLLAAGIVLVAVLAPFLGVAGRYMQVNRFAYYAPLPLNNDG